MVNKRILYYKNYKKISGKSEYDNIKFPLGNYNVWKNAYKNAIEQNYNDRFNDLISGNKKRLVINFENNSIMKYNILLEILRKKVNLLKKNGFIYFKYSNQNLYYTVSKNFLDKVEKIRPGDIITREEAFGSDAEYVLQYQTSKKIEFTFITKDDLTERNKKIYDERKGEFFKYLVDEKIYMQCWERYGIFKNIDVNNYVENCLFIALKNHTDENNEPLLNEEELQSISLCFKKTMIPIREIKIIAEKLNIYINIFDVQNNKYVEINKEGKRKFYIGLIEKHYYIIDNKTNCTKYYLDNFEFIKTFEKELNNKPNRIYGYKVFNNRNNKKYFIRKYEDKYNVNSTVLFRYLLKHKDKILKEIDNDTVDINYTPYYDQVKESGNLDYSIMDIQKVKRKRKMKTDKKIVVIYFDTETYINFENNAKPYMICARDFTNEIRYYETGKDCVFNFFQKILQNYNDDKDEIYFIAHNLGYDFRMIMSYQYCTILNSIERGNRVILASMLLHGRNGKRLNITFKDSMSFINSKLKKFPEIFNIKNIQKEAICYDWYNKNTLKFDEEGSLNNFYMSYDECMEIANKSKQFINKEELDDFEKDFKDTIDKWELDINKIDMVEYCKKYCIMDVNVLALGFQKFKDWMYEITEINIINEAATISSLADQYCKNQGVYDGCYQLANKPRLFIQKTVEGGRVMTNNNEKYYVEEEVQDFDGVSLYLSAMNRMDGFLKGIPKVIKEDQLNEDFLLNQTAFFVEVECLKVDIKRGFPLLRVEKDEIKKDSKGKKIKTTKNENTNDVVGKRFYLNKIKYEDCKKFQGMEFKIIRGYYFNEGFNTKIKDVTKFLFEERLKKKKEGNPIQEAYKLIGNSIYGKTIEKEHNKEKAFFNSEEEMKRYVLKNHNCVESLIKLDNDKWCVNRINAINIHYSRPHIGSEILAMSKRIMNEVMCCAEDNEIFIYYQDTDSMHLRNNDIEKLSTAFKKEYGRDLIGKNLGEFHCDFPYKSDILPYAVKSIFLGKKSYYDLVKTVINGKEKYIEHIRLKGIPERAIRNHKDYSTLEIYERMYVSKRVNFNMKDAGCIMEYMRDYNICERSDDYSREIVF